MSPEVTHIFHHTGYEARLPEALGNIINPYDPKYNGDMNPNLHRLFQGLMERYVYTRRMMPDINLDYFCGYTQLVDGVYFWKASENRPTNVDGTHLCATNVLGEPIELDPKLHKVFRSMNDYGSNSECYGVLTRGSDILHHYLRELNYCSMSGEVSIEYTQSYDHHQKQVVFMVCDAWK